MNKKTVLGLAIVVAAFAIIGALDSDSGQSASASSQGGWFGHHDGGAPDIRYVHWTDPDGLFSAEVPAGWHVVGRVNPQGLDKGAFMIQGFSPDGRSMFTFAHNWLWFMEYQYGPYQPGRATLERFVVPGLARNLPQMGLRRIRVVYRSPDKSFRMANPYTGLSLRGDSGIVGILAMNANGEALAGTLLGETMYMPTPGSPGLWSLRIFSGGLAPATPAQQAAILAIQNKVVNSLVLSPRFRQAWQNAHNHTVALMQKYNSDMDRLFDSYLQSSGRDSAPGGKDPLDGWAEMMRGGHYEKDNNTGEQFWVSNNHKYWWKNDRDVVVGNDTGDPPSGLGNWYRLYR